ncbi:MAG: sensor histidine kinase [Thermoleophilaceae bacterium]
MSLLFAACGWCAAGVLGVGTLRLRGRLEAASRAEHELRGPVTVLRLGVERLRREPGGGRHAPLLDAQLERLCAGLADLQGVHGRGRAEQPREPVDLAGFLRGTAEGWRLVLGATGRELHTRWERPPGTLEADRGRLAQALGNLMANAWEHGSGPVELRALPAERAVRVEVVSSARPASPSRRGGRGLAIAAAAARELNGRLVLESHGERRVAGLELPLDDAA